MKLFAWSEDSSSNLKFRIAAARLYEVNGNKKTAKRIDKAREEYDKRLEKFFLEMDDEEEEFGWDDEELPFS